MVDADTPAGLVIHAPTAEAAQRALNNVKNFQRAEPGVPVLLVANGPAVRYLVNEVTPAQMNTVYLCENSLAAQGLSPGEYRTIPSAVVEVHRLQQLGWSYWRA